MRKRQVWIQLDLEAHPDEYDSLIARLTDFETCGFQEESESSSIELSAFFTPEGPIEQFQQRFEAALAQRRLTPGVRFSELRADPGEWLQEARRCFRGFSVGETFYIHPGWEEPSPAFPVCILIEPGLAFGTGTHESTRLALRNLEATVPGSRTVLDIGTGSGILALAAAGLNPSTFVTAIDIDEEATRCAASNFGENNVTNIQLAQAGVEAMASRWDLVVANLTGRILESLSGQIDRVTGRDLIVSGFLCAAGPAVLESFRGYGFRKQRELVDRGWSSLHLRRFE